MEEVQKATKQLTKEVKNDFKQIIFDNIEEEGEVKVRGSEDESEMIRGDSPVPGPQVSKKVSHNTPKVDQKGQNSENPNKKIEERKKQFSLFLNIETLKEENPIVEEKKPKKNRPK